MNEYIPILGKLASTWQAMLDHAREGIYQFAMFGMTQQRVIDMKAVVTMLVVGAVSAFGGAYINSERTAVKLEQYAKAQEDFRSDMRQFIRENSLETRSVNDRLTRQEILLQTHIASAIDRAVDRSNDAALGMAGMTHGSGKR